MRAVLVVDTPGMPNVPHAKRPGEWVAGSATIDGTTLLESERPTWLLRARKGRWWVDLAGGPMSSRPFAMLAASVLNDSDPRSWDAFILRQLRDLIEGRWG